MIKLVMFDWDGVIADGLDINYKIYQEITKRLGKKTPESPQALARLTNGKYEELYYNLGIRTDEEAEKASEIYAEFFERFKNDFKIYPGIRELLKTLKKRGVKIAVITNCLRPLMLILVDRFGLSRYFDLIVTHEDSEKIKPDPDQIHICLEKLNVRPEEAIFVGDMTNDVKAARNANLSKVIAVTYGWHTREQLEKLNPDVIVDSASDILENLK